MLYSLSGFVNNFEIPQEWIYRGEGNCNLVLSLPKFRKILRVRKIDRPKTLIERLIVWIMDFLYWYCRKSINEETRDLKFYSGIMRPLIGRKYTSDVNQVILNKKQTKVIENSLSKYRPEFRRIKTLQYERAALFDDLAFLSKDDYDYLPFEVTGNTFAIEIKPKQGWRPLSEKHFSKCVFCMNQYLKMERRQIKQFSKYCPEDLFSGNADRMNNAINSLINVPQNNFRIFKNGNLCFGDKVETQFKEVILEIFETSDEANRLQEEFCKLIQQCLVTNLYNTDVIGNCQEKLFCEWNEIIEERNFDTVLPKGCVLKQILSVQMLDTEGSNYYNKLLNRGNCDNWKYVNLMLNKLYSRNACLKCTLMILSNEYKKKEDSDLHFIPYMVSSIAKDCSLMITLRKIKENIEDNFEMKNVIKTEFGYYLVKIGVFDLYPKPLSVIKKHYKRNKEIIQAYMKAMEKCVNIDADMNS